MLDKDRFALAEQVAGVSDNTVRLSVAKDHLIH
jgi:hypothetical protein